MWSLEGALFYRQGPQRWKPYQRQSERDQADTGRLRRRDSGRTLRHPLNIDINVQCILIPKDCNLGIVSAIGQHGEDVAHRKASLRNRRRTVGQRHELRYLEFTTHPFGGTFPQMLPAVATGYVP